MQGVPRDNDLRAHERYIPRPGAHEDDLMRLVALQEQNSKLLKEKRELEYQVEELLPHLSRMMLNIDYTANYSNAIVPIRKFIRQRDQPK